MSLKPKSIEESKAEMTVRMFPSDANPAGNVFGGEILRQIDLIAGLVAQRHCKKNAVTASIDWNHESHSVMVVVVQNSGTDRNRCY